MNKPRTIPESVRRTLYRCLIGFSIVLISCHPSTPTSKEESVRIAYQPIVFGLPVFLGLEDQIFSQHGLKVSPIQFTSANDMLNALVAGDVDIIPGAPLVPVVALEAQYPGRFRIISHSVMTASAPFDRILVKSSSPVASLGDLSNKKLALLPGTTAINATRAFLKKHDVDPTTVEFIQLAPTAQLAALGSGSVDALYAYEPLVSIALAKNNLYRPLTGSIYTDLLEPCPLVVSIVDRRFDHQHPVAVERATNAFREIFQRMHDNPAQAALALVPYLNIPPDVAPHVSVQNMTPPGTFDLNNLQTFINLLTDIGEIQKPIDARSLTQPTEPQ